MIKFFKRPGLFVKGNASTLLTFIGAGGVLLTSVLTAKGTVKAIRALDKAKAEKNRDLTPLETVKIAAPAYIPATISGLSTMTCIFGANILNKRSQAALTSAYALLDNSYKQYRAKVSELYGEDSDVKIQEEIAKDMYEEMDPSINDEQHLFWDSISMRYFETTLEKLQSAEYELNRKLLSTGYASINDFYEMLDVARIDFGDRLGWTMYDRGRISGCSTIEFYHHKTALDDGLECCMIYTSTEPSFDYLDY